jgi:uncharacterized membrane protein
MANFAIAYRRLTETLWFVPTVLTAGGVALGNLLVGVDRYAGYELKLYPRLFGVESSGSRDMLAVIAGSMITVAGTVFSITIVALVLASTQFSPRILRNFMRDGGNQTVLGVFVGIFAYCLVVLRTIRDSGESGDFVPSLAVAVGFLLGLVGIGFLIYHIHHVATTIQASNIISSIAKETIEVIQNLYPTPRKILSAEEIEQYERQIASADWFEIRAEKNGYIQTIDYDALFELAKRKNVLIRQEQRIGEFALHGEPLLSVGTLDPNFVLERDFTVALQNAIEIGTFRTIEQDPAFGVRQITDIALKALSPAINDTTTAVICIDHLSWILNVYVGHSTASPYRPFDRQMRIIAKSQTFEDLFDLAFHQIRQNAGGNVAVMLRQISALESLGEGYADSPEATAERLELIENQRKRIARLAEQTIADPDDLNAVRRALEKTKKK